MPISRLLLALLLGLVVVAPVAAADGPPPDLSFWSAVPFALLLLAIALLPLFAPHFWHSNRNRGIVSAAFALPVVAYLLYEQTVNEQATLALLSHEIENYIAFIILLGSLYIIAGGILLAGDIRPGPISNTLLLALGACLANLIGTTGASMLLIRPFLRINHQRTRKSHLPVFFIFVVSNLGGLLTPLGDPPLFLGYLNGVPFSWTLTLWPQWLLANSVVLLIFLAWDAWALSHEAPAGLVAERGLHQLRLRGLINLPLLAGIVVSVMVQGVIGGRQGAVLGCLLMSGMALVSLAFTPRSLREANGFSWAPIAEVAILFAGIFVCMVPALALLEMHGSSLGVRHPWQFFWMTGALSSFLDNAPTYVTFATLAAGGTNYYNLAQDNPLILAAISCGAVFMGANTYIGNGPNFMVKAVAEEAGYPMPSFFGYMVYSGTILLPVFLLVTLVFFAGW